MVLGNSGRVRSNLLIFSVRTVHTNVFRYVFVWCCLLRIFTELQRTTKVFQWRGAEKNNKIKESNQSKISQSKEKGSHQPEFYFTDKLVTDKGIQVLAKVNLLFKIFKCPIITCRNFQKSSNNSKG